MPQPPTPPALGNRSFVLLLVLVTVAFGWILWPLAGSVLWAMALAIVFRPLYLLALRRSGRRPNTAALLTVLAIVLLVILPLSLVLGTLLREGSVLVQKVQSGQISFSVYLVQIYDALPSSVREMLTRLDADSIATLKLKLGAALNQGSQVVAGKLLGIGQDAFDFLVSFGVMLYLLYFLLRDGERLSTRIRLAIPLPDRDKRQLAQKFRTVIRATVKGNIAVAMLQGALGGLAFWVLGINAPVLWAVLMAFLSLLPAVGAGLVWLPVALYLLATGHTGAGVGLIAYGALVIGMVDNVLRPLLVGKDTKMPDYVVLLSTLGGMAVFGLNGFVIGPLIAAMFLAVWDIVAQQQKHSPAEAPPTESQQQP
ncbi:AI-2E family transporter [Roseateles sp. BYS180W]|uniref:AI-2E family transporter n=1 Tax=Roseateles rivi TaxID=3299028 RepID=A0ABW7FW64_9BURK